MTEQQKRALSFFLGVGATTVTWSIFAYIEYKRGIKEQENAAQESRLLWTATGIVRERVRRGEYHDDEGIFDRDRAFQDLEFEKIRVANDDLADILFE